MNHIYRVVWSKTRLAWVVVSELASACGKGSGRCRSSRVNSIRGITDVRGSTKKLLCGASSGPSVGHNLSICDSRVRADRAAVGGECAEGRQELGR